MYARRLEDDGVIKAGHLDEVKKWADELVDRAAQLVISEPWPKPEHGRRRRVQGRSAARPRRGARTVAPSCAGDGGSAAARNRPAVRQEGQHLPRSGDARRRRCAEGRSARVRLRRRRRRPVRQCVSAAAAAAEGLRRSHSQLAARRRRGARRLRRRRAGGAAADRRDAVQRLRRDRLQSAGQQRREDSLSLGRGRADGGAHAVGRPAPRRPVSQPEHRAVVLSHARPEDRRPVDAGRRARVDGRRGRRSRSGAVSTSTSRSIAIRASSRCCRPMRRRQCRSARPPCGGRAATSR